jgi:two-component system sensor histidine kinase HydH
MASRRAAYIPIASIVICIVLLAVAVGFISYRDIGRGREQLSEVLWYQARGILMFLQADLRAELASPSWRSSRIHSFFEEVKSTHPGVAYLALLDGDGTVLVHSDSEQVGATLPDAEENEEIRGDRANLRRVGLPGGHGPTGIRVDIAVGTRTLESDGRRVYEYRVTVELPPPEAPEYGRRRIGQGRMGPRGAVTPPDPEVIRERFSELFGRPVAGDAPVPVTAVVGLDATDLEAAFHSSRNYTLMLAGVLLLVGGAAIYFLFVIATYRSTRTALENMRSYTSNIIESMTSGLVSLDADGDVVTVNAGARSILGLGSEVVDGARVEEVVRVESAPHRAEVERVLNGERDVFETETRVAGRDGAVPVALSASSLRDEEGERAGTVLLFQDLREIEELKEAVERERHLASLGRLAAGVAHEVRNPLSSLKGFAQFFRTKFKPGSEEERYSDIMIEEVERLDRVVQELLDFARPVEPDRRPTPSATIVEEALALVSEDAQFRRVTIVKGLEDGLPDVLVDPLQIRQALLNVLLNAIEAMGEGGTLTIETAATSSADGPPSVTLSVTDTGEGMSAEEVGKLFEPFYTTKPSGTGLGLTVVSRVVEQNGGRVSVKSARGEGTTFSLVLPIAGGE